MKPDIGKGDSGRTRIFGCELDKTSPLVALIGHIDELNSFIGFSRSFLDVRKNATLKDLDEIMKKIQDHLFLIGSELAGAKLDRKVEMEEVKWLEDVIEKCEKEVEPLRNFIYPTGSLPSSSLQVARAVCRRVEREAFKFSRRKRVIRNEILSYLNRLSDVLFILARVINKRMQFQEEIWKIK